MGVAGGSYGGALALLGAAYDDRIDAIAPQITWNSLTAALFPSQAGDGRRGATAGRHPAGRADAGVYKRLWAGLFFGVGSAPGGGLLGALGGGGDGAAPAASRTRRPLDPAAVTQALTCGRFRADICAAYQSAAATGTLTPEIAAVLDRSSPAGVLDRITAPTLLVQGTQDSLFGLGQADANARGIAANGTPVKVRLVRRRARHGGLRRGHRRPPRPGRRLVRLVPARRRAPTPAPGSSSRRPPGSAAPAAAPGAGRQPDRRGAPPTRGWTAPRRADRAAVAVSGPTQPIVTPAGGTPARADHACPGWASLDRRARRAARWRSPVSSPPSTAEPLTTAVEVVGAPTIADRRLRAGRHGDAVRQALRRRARRGHDACRRAWSRRWR